MNYYLEVWPSKDGWRVRLRSRNGRIIMASEAYASRHNAMRIARRLERAFVLAGLIVKPTK